MPPENTNVKGHGLPWVRPADGQLVSLIDVYLRIACTKLARTLHAFHDSYSGVWLGAREPPVPQPPSHHHCKNHA